MEQDKEKYDELLENGKITKKQYDELVLGKVTIGLGFNQIREAIEINPGLEKEDTKDRVKFRQPKEHFIYTDSDAQYKAEERKKQVHPDYENGENLYVYEDEVSEYDLNNINYETFLGMKRMENAEGKTNNLQLIKLDSEDSSLEIMEKIAKAYNLDLDNTKVLQESKVIIPYSKDNKGKVKIGSILHSPIKENLTTEQKNKAKQYIDYQIRKCLKQINAKKENLDLSNLDDEQKIEINRELKEIDEQEQEK